MKYIECEDLFVIDINEFVNTSAKKYSHFMQRPYRGGSRENGIAASLDFTSRGLKFRISDEIFLLENSVLAYHSAEYGKPSASDARIARAIGFVSSYMLGGTEREIKPVILTDGGEAPLESETVSPEAQSRFFKKCVSSFAEYAASEIDRVKNRLPSMKTVKFPFHERREAQDEFIKAAYRTIARGGELFAEAPTGTGKTVSAIFPAVRAMGDGRCDKAFYLTPKTTTANAARDTVELLCLAGAKIRAVILPSKERACNSGGLCQRDGRRCEAGEHTDVSAAVRALFDSGECVISLDKIKSVAASHSVCPHELALSYAELCDIVICDFNYLFDPRVYIRRFFERGGEYAFLIDEAHNMPDRAREMYSAEFSEVEIDNVNNCGYFSENSDFLAEVNRFRGDFRELFFPLIKDEIREGNNGERHGAYHTKSLPEGLFDALLRHDIAVSAALDGERCAKDAEANARRKLIRDYLYSVRALYSAAERFDYHYELFVFLDGDTLRTKIFCLDTALALSERLEMGRAAVFFSATLSPIGYYRDALGAARSAGSICLRSPFVEEQLSVTVMDKVGTRLAEREDTLLAVCRIISATLSAKRGHYMIFAPSFSYAKLLYDIFSAKYPKIKSILQTPNMTRQQKDKFLDSLKNTDGSYLAAFSVLGGIFAEGVDLVGESLIGAVIVGIGMPQISYEREAIAAYYDEKLDEGKQHAYIYPGLNRVMQAAGRVIRSEGDRGVIVLIDDRFDDPIYRKTAPELWRGMIFLSTPKELREELDRFWAE